MHFRTDDPILFVAEEGMRNIDPQKPENLFGMWSVFSKASGIMENGKRLENMSWRLWNQQTLCPKPKRRARHSASTSSRPLLPHSAPPHPRLPELSSSVDSACSTSSGDAGKSSSSTESLTLHHRIGDAMCAVSDNDITSAHLESLVTSIKVSQSVTAPLPLPTAPSTPRMSPSKQDSTSHSTPPPCTSSSSSRPINVESSASTLASSTTESTYLSPTNASETSVGSDSSQHSVVRGFELGTGISTYRSQSQLAPSPAPILKSPSQSQYVPQRRKGGVFQLSASSGEDESSLREHMASTPQSNSLRHASDGSSHTKKQISFVDDVSEAPKKTFMFADDDDDDGAAVESEPEDDSQDDEEVSESAIDDDDAWEDEGETEEPPKQIEFHRVESKPDLVSRRSMLTDNIHESSRASALQNAASRSSPLMRRSRTSTPNGPSMPASPTEDSPMKLQGAMENGTLGQSPASPNARSIVVAPTNPHPPCPPMSPRATRRNMVSQELGVSLRKHMLNERQYKNVYANNSSPLRRAHTATDVRIPEQSQEPGPTYPMFSRAPKIGASNDDFDHDLSDYHRKGW